MPITSDLTLDAAKFHPSSVSEETKKINALFEHITAKGPQWHEIGIAKYRQMREIGKTSMPLPVYLPGAREATVPSREAGRDIPLRVYRPDNGQPSRGVFLHFHGGGSDSSLKMYANKCQLTAVSVGYRLAPEDPYPAAIHDSFDVAEYLVDHAEQEYGGKLLFIGGESAGACLTALTAFQLMRLRPAHRLAGLIFPYGLFDLTLGLPKVFSFTKPLVVNVEELQQFGDAYVPGMSTAERKHPSVSPLYEDMQALASASPKQSLPPALFLCGTEDPLLDDTLLMSVKWMAAGSEAILKIYPGAPHGFTIFPGVESAEEAAAVTIQFVREKLGAAM
ncbi:MAG: hypothetical protein M1839_006222 [Geoglossum umbratile]|nr:MAG: hypothetical protein M1839_006222 [Geoglossum umbratile]